MASKALALRLQHRTLTDSGRRRLTFCASINRHLRLELPLHTFGAPVCVERIRVLATKLRMTRKLVSRNDFVKLPAVLASRLKCAADRAFIDIIVGSSYCIVTLLANYLLVGAAAPGSRRRFVEFGSWCGF